MMNARLFRLLESRHRIDRALRIERERAIPDPLRLLRLQLLQWRARLLTRRLAQRMLTA